MFWIGIAIGIVAVLGLGAAVARRRSTDPARFDDVDPMFATGIVLTGAGVALATTLGPIMYVVMTIGLIAMAIGAHRTRQHGHR